MGKTAYQNHQSRSTLLRPDVYIHADNLSLIIPEAEIEDAIDPAKDQTGIRIPTAIA